MRCSIHVPELLTIFHPELLKVEVVSKEVETREPLDMFAEGAKATFTQRTDVETQLEALARLAVLHQLRRLG
jgi:hypothetical protein